METAAEEAGTNGWVKNGDYWTYYENNEKVCSDWRKIGGKWYYFDSEGYMIANDYILTHDKFYFFDASGAMIGGTGWKSLTFTYGGSYSYTEWFYLKGGVALTGWQKLSGKWYYLDPYMYVGPCEVDGKHYLFNASGVWQSGTGWKFFTENGYTYWFYLKDSEYVTGWQTIGSKQYYFNPVGVMAVGVVEVDGKNYLFSSSGALAKKGSWVSTSWKFSDGSTYTYWNYAVEDGVPAYGWQTIGGKQYYFDEWGDMVTGIQEIDGVSYVFGADGALVKNGWTSRKIYWADGTSETRWFYAGADGTAYTGWVKSGSDWYYVDNGWTSSGTQYIDGVVYVFNQNGTLSKGGWVKAVWHMESGTETHWYYANKDGTAYTGWLKSGSSWYYFDAGYSATGLWWVEADEQLYLFNENGTLSKGGWVKSTVIYEDGSEKDEWFYANTNGTPKTGWQQLSGKWYYFNEQSHYEMVANTTMTIDGVSYTFDANGVCTNK